MIGFIAFSQVLSLFPDYIHLQKTSSELILLTTAVPFSLLGLFGVMTLHRAKLDLYSAFKRLEFTVILCICGYETGKFGQESWENMCSYLFFAGLRLVLDFYGTYVAWSSSVKLRSCGSLDYTSEIKVETAELTGTTDSQLCGKFTV